MAATVRRKPNILLIAIDSLLADHMSLYGYGRLTTPHIDRFAGQGTVFERTYSAHIPTTPAYSSMLTGRDVFGTTIVALRHQGGLPETVRTLPEILKNEGYNTTCVGFGWNAASRGFDKYLEYQGWGSWDAGRSPKAQLLNEVAQPEIDRLAAENKPFFMLLRHMDPHSPYLPPEPFDRIFYHGNELDPANKSMEQVMAFKPFCDYFRSWMPPGISDKNYVIAQYDGAIAYMDSCIQRIFTQLGALGILDNTIVVINGDHGETLYDHECWFDHHGLYDVTLHVPLIIRYPAKIPAGRRLGGYNRHQDIVPTVLDLADIKPRQKFDGQSLLALVNGQQSSFDSEFYITECTWMRKHGWRTPEWKLIVALEPDFHFKPPVELYNLVRDPGELKNVAAEHPDVAAMLTKRMHEWIARRESETGNKNPIYTPGVWHGHQAITGPFESAQQAYDTLHIGDPTTAARLQANNKYADRGEHQPDETRLITVIGRGHGGTRAMSHTLSQSGVYMGNTLNISGDLLPPEDLYEACRIMAGHVKYLGKMRWDFSALHAMPIDPEFEKLVKRYLTSVLESPAKTKGWKLPETTLIFPWIVRMFPDAYYIHWLRDPRDSIMGGHRTDDLADFGVDYEKTADVRRRRAISWKYQAAIVAATPKPKRFFVVKFEDFVQQQEPTLQAVSDFLGIPLVKIKTDASAVGRYKMDQEQHDFDFLNAEMQSAGYGDQRQEQAAQKPSPRKKPKAALAKPPTKKAPPSVAAAGVRRRK